VKNKTPPYYKGKHTKAKPRQLTVLSLQKFLYPVDKFSSAPGITKYSVFITTTSITEELANR
jgi:hypothetical protein